jgi:mannose-6-phosphate isomerase-like protein (cupin superfamily)
VDRKHTLSLIANNVGNRPTKCIPDNDNPDEIICELGKLNGEVDQSTAIAVIDQSQPHYHKQMTEVYTVEEGMLTVHINSAVIILRTGDTLIIPPGHVHSALGVATIVRVDCSPAWTPEDHFLV